MIGIILYRPEKPSNVGNIFRTAMAIEGKLIIIGPLSFELDDPETNFPDIVHAILKGNCFDWVTDAMESECIEAKELLSPFFGNNEKNVSGAYDNLCTAMTPFSNPILT